MRTLTVALLAVLASACATESADVATQQPGGGGKGDDASGEPALCATEWELIEAVREQLVAAEPDVYDDASWDDELATVERIGDLDLDDTEDLLVRPGYVYAGGNEDLVIVFSSDEGCADPTIVGRFSGVDLEAEPTGRTSRGVVDIIVTFMNECTATAETFAFDGAGYVSVETTEYQACTEE